MMFISTPDGLNPRVWENLNKGLSLVGEEQLEIYVQGISESLKTSEAALELPDEVLRSALNVKAECTTEELRAALQLNIETTKRWLELYSKKN